MATEVTAGVTDLYPIKLELILLIHFFFLFFFVFFVFLEKTYPLTVGVGTGGFVTVAMGFPPAEMVMGVATGRFAILPAAGEGK